MADMTKCSLCGKEKFAKSCIHHFIKTGGEYFEALPYSPRNKTLAEIHGRSERRCSGCGVAEGGYHHVGCPAEICPRCSNWWISCRCQGFKTVQAIKK